jgi:hypothetical protein
MAMGLGLGLEVLGCKGINNWARLGKGAGDLGYGTVHKGIIE